MPGCPLFPLGAGLSSPLCRIPLLVFQHGAPSGAGFPPCAGFPRGGSPVVPGSPSCRVPPGACRVPPGAGFLLVPGSSLVPGSPWCRVPPGAGFPRGAGFPLLVLVLFWLRVRPWWLVLFWCRVPGSPLVPGPCLATHFLTLDILNILKQFRHSFPFILIILAFWAFISFHFGHS